MFLADHVLALLNRSEPQPPDALAQGCDHHWNITDSDSFADCHICFCSRGSCAGKTIDGSEAESYGLSHISQSPGKHSSKCLACICEFELGICHVSFSLASRSDPVKLEKQYDLHVCFSSLLLPFDILEVSANVILLLPVAIPTATAGIR